MPADFHFLTPEWFLALLPLAAVLWGASRRGVAQNAWQRVVDRHLLPYLLVGQAGAARWLPLTLVAAGWLVAVVALANPSYERRPAPAVRPVDARVVVLDLSHSMDAADLKPSRLARARYKVADILNRSRDGQVGLVAFAGDAFVVAPLSDDAGTLLGMLDALSPEVMPVRGSRPDLGLAKAGELLTQGGARGGEVILVGDDAGDERARAAAASLVAEGRTLSVIGVGTAEGAPVPGARDADGKPVMAQLDAAALQSLARAGGGDYATLTPDRADLDLVLHRQSGRVDPGQDAAKVDADQWEGLGPWLTLALLPLAALAFRRGWLVGAALTLVLTQGILSPRPALALTWDDLWQRPDQQAAAALAQGDHRRALDLAEQPDQRGTASYRLGDYQSAAESFGVAGSADGDYNRGNALARAGKLQEAIAAYGEALKLRPGMEDAVYNKARVEELLKRQQQQQNSNSSQTPVTGPTNNPTRRLRAVNHSRTRRASSRTRASRDRRAISPSPANRAIDRRPGNRDRAVRPLMNRVPSRVGRSKTPRLPAKIRGSRLPNKALSMALSKARPRASRAGRVVRWRPTRARLRRRMRRLAVIRQRRPRRTTAPKRHARRKPRSGRTRITASSRGRLSRLTCRRKNGRLSRRRISGCGASRTIPRGC